MFRVSSMGEQHGGYRIAIQGGCEHQSGLAVNGFLRVDSSRRMVEQYFYRRLRTTGSGCQHQGGGSVSFHRIGIGTGF